MPMRACAPSTATHSCSSLYFSCSGNSMGQDANRPHPAPRISEFTVTCVREPRDAREGGSAEDLADALDVLLRVAAGVRVAAGLGPHVGECLVGIGQHEGPPLVLDHLHAVDHLRLPRAGALDDLAH